MREDQYDVLKRRMQEKGLLSEEVDSGRSTKALDWYLDLRRYGSVPHGGWGLGLERLIETFTGVQNIRDVIAFPKTASATDLMSDCPNMVSEGQLEELHIKVTK